MRTITTYGRFHRHIRAWAAGEIDPLLVLGPPGNGKTFAYEQALEDTPYHLFRARTTPINVYNELYDDPDKPVVLDDISSLLRDDNFLDLLKSLCESGGDRIVRWRTTTKLLQGRAQSFGCTSRVLIVLNDLPPKRPDVAAVLDRCDAIHFAPTKAEIIAQMRQAFPGDDELVDLIQRLAVLPSLRTLIKARKWCHSNHLDVVEELLSECQVSEEMHMLIQIMTRHPEREWCQRYVEATGMTERTYRRHKHLAAQVVECWTPEDSCPNVRPPTPNPDNRTANPESARTTPLTDVSASQLAN